MLQKHRLRDAVLKASKENRILYDMSFKNDEPNRTHEKRGETQCEDVVMKKEMDGRMNGGRSSVDRSIVLVNKE